MPLDDTAESDFLTYMLQRLERAGVINDPAGTSRFMLLRDISADKRRAVMQFLHPHLFDVAA
jgi:hypothetical protein